MFKHPKPALWLKAASLSLSNLLPQPIWPKGEDSYGMLSFWNMNSQTPESHLQPQESVSQFTALPHKRTDRKWGEIGTRAQTLPNCSLGEDQED